MANKPNNPSLWSRAKSLAKQKFDVYPSAYANGWAAKWYKSKGGTWRKAEYGMQVMGEGGTNNPGFEALPEYVQAKILANMGYGGMTYPFMQDGGEPDGSMALGQIDAAMDKLQKLRQFIQPESDLEPWVSSKLTLMDHYTDAVSDYMMYNPEAQSEQMEMMKRGGYVVTRSNDRKGKTHKVTGPDGTVKYFGDSKLGQHPKDPERKKAFYARHKKNLAGNPYFRAFARATWEDGGEIPDMQNGGYVGYDGKRHISNTPTWSGNAGYEDGGELPMAVYGLTAPGILPSFFNNFFQTVNNSQQRNSTGQYPLQTYPKTVATYDEKTGMFHSPLGYITKNDTKQLGFSDSGLYVKDEAKNLQNTLNTGSAKQIRQGIKGFNENFDTNLKAPGLIIGKKGRDAMTTMGNFSNIAKMGIGTLSAATDMFINNPRIKQQNKQQQMFSGMTDALNMVAPEDRGDYVAAGSRIGELRPDQYVVNKGMYTGQFYPAMNMMQTGGVIPEELSMPLELVEMPMNVNFNTNNTSTSAPAPETKSAYKSSGANPLAEQTWADVSSEFEGVKHLGIWGDKRHQKTKSDHNSGDALDIGIKSPEQGEQIAQKLIKEAADRNVKYIIWNKQIWNPSISNSWRPYSGDNPHTSHVHVSFNRNQQDLGQISLTHNNPLNIHQGDFASKYGGKQGAKDGGGHVSMFPDMTTGITAAKDLLFGPSYSNLSISQARNKWVSGNSGTPNESTSYIVKAIGSDKKIKDLTTAEKEKLIKEFARWEGKQAYNKIKDMPLFDQGGSFYYDQGGVYDLTEDEIRSILSAGGNVEFI